MESINKTTFSQIYNFTVSKGYNHKLNQELLPIASVLIGHIITETERQVDNHDLGDSEVVALVIALHPKPDDRPGALHGVLF